jgi:signal transduction histidine kinase
MYKSLTGRLAIFLAAATLITLGVLTAIERSVHKTRIRDASIKQYQVIAGQTLSVMLLAMKGEPPGSIDEYLASLATGGGVDRIRVLDESGVIEHSSDVAEIGRTSRNLDRGWLLKKERALYFEEEKEDLTVTILEPIANEARCQRCHQEGPVNGVLEVRLGASEVVTVLEAEQWTVLVVLGLSMLLLFGLLWFFSRRYMIRPVRALLESMRRVGSGNLTERVQVESPREFAELGEQFNAMVEKLGDAREQLDIYYQESLARADRLATVGELATATAHEIQNPLAGLSGAMQILRDDPALKDRREILDEALSTVDRLGKTVHDLLSYGRPPEPKFIKCDLNRAVKAALLFVRQQLASTNSVKIVEEFRPDLPRARADPQLLQQVVLNVCLNAVQAMKKGGILKLTTAAHNGRAGPGSVSITVSDTGPGIPEADIGNIFKPFFTTKNRGTGLGLAISKSIIERHCGQIRITSEEGQGTTAVIELPLEDDQDQPGAERGVERNLGNGR